jgi:hypothetical protein
LSFQAATPENRQPSLPPTKRGHLSIHQTVVILSEALFSGAEGPAFVFFKLPPRKTASHPYHQLNAVT